ncbi:hypothetical protein [Streptomyces pristinaespiralis]|uniref:hypothetical protein n=1 Tax=Streptomyces pristinaespiralis TaxID=38300 RepID=UPI00340480C2
MREPHYAPVAATVGAITLVAAATGTADAADTSRTLTRSGSTIGTMTHLDPDRTRSASATSGRTATG